METNLKSERRAELAEEFLISIGQVIRGMDAIFRREFEEYEVTWPQFHMLKMIKFHGKTGVTDLSNLLMIAPPTASRMINGLTSKGLVVKEKDPSDQRVTLVALTQKSERLMEKLMKLQAEVMIEVFEGEDERELERTITGLKKLSERLFVGGDRKGKMRK